MSHNEQFPNPCAVCGHRQPQATLRLFSAIASPCAHVYCYECAARREFCSLEENCPICHVQLNKVFVTRGQPNAAEARSLLNGFLQLGQFARPSKFYVGKLWYDIEDGEAINQKLKLLSYFQCSSCTDLALIRNLKVMEYNKFDFDYASKHLQNKHDLYMCELCFLTLKPFSINLEQMTHELLESHMREGSQVLGHGLIKHSECVLCPPVPDWQSKWHWDDAALALHQAEKHVKCHYCDNGATGTNPKYFVNQLSLNVHLEKEHFLCDFCPRQECGRKIGFASLYDFEIHVNDKHSESQQITAQVVAVSKAAVSPVSDAPPQIPLIRFDDDQTSIEPNRKLPAASSTTYSEEVYQSARSIPAPSPTQSMPFETNRLFKQSFYQELPLLGQAANRNPWNRRRNHSRGDTSPFHGRGRGRGHL